MHQTNQVVDFVDDNYGVIKEPLSVGVLVTCVLFQLGGGDTIVANKRNAGFHHPCNLFSDVFSVLWTELSIVVKVGRLSIIGNPDDLTLGRTGENTFQVGFRQGQDFGGIERHGGGVRFQAHRYPVIVDVEMTESTEGDFGHKVWTKRERGHHNNLLVGRTIQGLRRRNRRTRFA